MMMTEANGTSHRGTSTVKPRILVVEDETALVEILRYNLEKEGFDVAVAVDGEEAMAAINDHPPDLVVLDWMLPLVSGLEICRQIRRKTETRDLPVIMLTARGEETDRVRGLEVGADDYVSKPFSPSELIARVRAVLRRARPATAGDLLTYAGIVMDLSSHRVLRDGRAIHLGPTEFRLLRFLMERPGRVYSREQLLDAVWGRDIYVEVRTVDVHIRRLRKALNGPKDIDLIRTVRSAGYALDELAQ
jgi:two-component system phosphate regulon response regulator PhoB